MKNDLFEKKDLNPYYAVTVESMKALEIKEYLEGGINQLSVVSEHFRNHSGLSA